MAIESTGSGGGNTVREVKVTAPVDADGRLLVSGITEHDTDSGPVTIDAEQWSALLAALAAGGTGGGGGGTGDGTPGDDGRGITSITASGTTATVHYTDGTTSTFTLPQAPALTPRSVSSIVAAANGLSAVITYSDSTTATIALPQGAAGTNGRSVTGITASGTTATVTYSTGPSSTFTLPQAPALTPTDGKDGRGITSIVAAANGLSATITFSDATTSSVALPKGADGKSVTGITASGTTATVTYSGGTTSTFTLPQAPAIKGDAGRGITSIVAAADGLSATITYTDATTTSIALPRGLAGRGITSVTSANGVATVHYTDNGTDTFVLPKGNDSTVPGPVGRGIASITSSGTTATVTYTDDSTSTFELPAATGGGAVLPGITPVGDWNVGTTFTAGQSVWARPDGALVQATVDNTGVYPFNADGTTKPEWVQLTARGLPGLPGDKGLQDTGLYAAGTTFAQDDLVREPGKLETIYRSLQDGNTAHPLNDTAWWTVFLKAERGLPGANGFYIQALRVEGGVLIATLNNGSEVRATGDLVTGGDGSGGGTGGGVSNFFDLTGLQIPQFIPDGSILKYAPPVDLHLDMGGPGTQIPTGTFSMEVTQTVATYPNDGGVSTAANGVSTVSTRTFDFTVTDPSLNGLQQALGPHFGNDYYSAQIPVPSGLQQQFVLRYYSSKTYGQTDTNEITSFSFKSDFFKQYSFFPNASDTITATSQPRRMVLTQPDIISSLPGIVSRNYTNQSISLGNTTPDIYASTGLSAYQGQMNGQSMTVTAGTYINRAQTGGNSGLISVNLNAGPQSIGKPPVGGSWLITGEVVARKHYEDFAANSCLGAWTVCCYLSTPAPGRLSITAAPHVALFPGVTGVNLFPWEKDGLDATAVLTAAIDSNLDDVIYMATFRITETVMQ